MADTVATAIERADIISGGGSGRSSALALALRRRGNGSRFLCLHGGLSITSLRWGLGRGRRRNSLRRGRRLRLRWRRREVVALLLLLMRRRRISSLRRVLWMRLVLLRRRWIRCELCQARLFLRTFRRKESCGIPGRIPTLLLMLLVGWRCN